MAAPGGDEMAHPEDRADVSEWGHVGWAPPPLNLAAETEAYQVLLEGHRLDPGNEDLYADLGKAKAAMEIAWLHAQAQVTDGHQAG